MINSREDPGQIPKKNTFVGFGLPLVVLGMLSARQSPNDQCYLPCHTYAGTNPALKQQKFVHQTNYQTNENSYNYFLRKFCLLRGPKINAIVIWQSRWPQVGSRARA